VFDGFADERLDPGPVVLRVRRSPTTGPAVVLLHGHPRTAATWYAVARLLHQAGYTVVCPDLRGYGRSSKPATTDDHASGEVAASLLAFLGSVEDDVR
jgi:haloacetate dehalogenase